MDVVEESPEPQNSRTPYRAIGAAVATAVLVGSGVAAAYGMAHSRSDGTVTTAATSPTASATAPATTPVPTDGPAVRAAPAVPPEDTATAPQLPETVDLDTALASVAAAADGGLSVAVRDEGSGASAVYGEGTFDTASIVKVDILATLLLQAQDARRKLTAQENTYATAMIKTSDNVAACALWATIGRADGLAAANKRFGMTGTRGGHGNWWGLTQTTSEDQLTLLDAVFGDDSPLSETSRAYIQGLMERIAAGQDWGVSAAADTGTTTALKNGWLPRTATGLWDVNSIGRVESGGHTYLVAVLSDGHATQAAGIKTVEDAAEAALFAFGTAAG